MEILDCWAYGMLATLVTAIILFAARVEMIWICICISALFLFTVVGGIHFGEAL